jgi:hypothetical protein
MVNTIGFDDVGFKCSSTKTTVFTGNNLLSNYSFEDWTGRNPDSWTATLTNAVVTQETINVYEGSNAVKVNITVDNGTGIFEQGATGLTVGNIYVASVFGAKTATSSVSAKVEMGFLDDTVGAATQVWNFTTGMWEAWLGSFGADNLYSLAATDTYTILNTSAAPSTPIVPASGNIYINIYVTGLNSDALFFDVASLQKQEYTATTKLLNFDSDVDITTLGVLDKTISMTARNLGSEYELFGTDRNGAFTTDSSYFDFSYKPISSNRIWGNASGFFTISPFASAIAGTSLELAGGNSVGGVGGDAILYGGSATMGAHAGGSTFLYGGSGNGGSRDGLVIIGNSFVSPSYLTPNIDDLLVKGSQETIGTIYGQGVIQAAGNIIGLSNCYISSDLYVGVGGYGGYNFHVDSSGNVTAQGYGDFTADGIRTVEETIPVSNSPGSKGEITYGVDGGTYYVYICIANNTWRRAALSAF